MQNSSKTRDRAYVRHILVKQTDFERFAAHISAVPREKFTTLYRPHDSDYVWFHVKLKKQELLFIQLSFEVKVMRPDQKKPAGFTQGMWKLV